MANVGLKPLCFVIALWFKVNWQLVSCVLLDAMNCLKWFVSGVCVESALCKVNYVENELFKVHCLKWIVSGVCVESAWQPSVNLQNKINVMSSSRNNKPVVLNIYTHISTIFNCNNQPHNNNYLK